MKASNVGKVRRKVIVRGKNKTYSRSMMVRAQNLGMKAMHKELRQERADKRSLPLEKSLLQRAVGSLRSAFGRKTESRMYSMNHPGANSGSDHSWFALAVGAQRPVFANGTNRSAEFGSIEHAMGRMAAGQDAASAVDGLDYRRRTERRAFILGAAHSSEPSRYSAADVARMFGEDPANASTRPRTNRWGI